MSLFEKQLVHFLTRVTEVGPQAFCNMMRVEVGNPRAMAYYLTMKADPVKFLLENKEMREWLITYTKVETRPYPEVSDG